MMFHNHKKYIYIYISCYIIYICVCVCACVCVCVKVSLFDEEKKGLYFIFPNCNVFENGYIFIIAL